MHVLQGIILPVKKVKILNMSFVPLLYALIKIFLKIGRRMEGKEK